MRTLQLIFWSNISMIKRTANLKNISEVQLLNLKLCFELWWQCQWKIHSPCLIINVTFHRKRSTFQNVWRQSSGTKCTWTLTSNVFESTPFPMERHNNTLLIDTVFSDHYPSLLPWWSIYPYATSGSVCV